MERTAVYRIWREDTLLYVGMSLNPWARFAHHQSTKDWGKTATRMDIQWFDCRSDASREENRAIASEKPIKNGLDILSRNAVKTDTPLGKWISDAGITRTEFAKMAGIPSATIISAVSGNVVLVQEQAERIEQVTGGEVPASCLSVREPKSPRHGYQFVTPVPNTVTKHLKAIRSGWEAKK